MESSKLFVTAEKLIANYKKAFLGAIALNFILTLSVVYLALHTKDRDVVYLSHLGVEQTISEKMQARLHAEWIIRNLFEVDASSVNRKQNQALALGDVKGIIVKMQEIRFQEDIIRQRKAFSVSIDSLIVTNDKFPYSVQGYFRRIDSQSMTETEFTFQANIEQGSVKNQNPLGLLGKNVVVNVK
jgi:hypothetical protein